MRDFFTDLDVLPIQFLEPFIKSRVTQLAGIDKFCLLFLDIDNLCPNVIRARLCSALMTTWQNVAACSANSHVVDMYMNLQS